MDWTAWYERRQQAPAVKRVPVCADGEAVAALEEAETHRNRRHELPDLRAAVEAATIVITLKAIPGEYEQLKAEHRPAETNSTKEYADSFHFALVKRSIAEPADVNAEQLWSVLTDGERAVLFLAARDINETVPDLGFIKPDTGTTHGIGPDSTTALPEG